MSEFVVFDKDTGEMCMVSGDYPTSKYIAKSRGFTDDELSAFYFKGDDVFCSDEYANRLMFIKLCESDGYAPMTFERQASNLFEL